MMPLIKIVMQAAAVEHRPIRYHPRAMTALLAATAYLRGRRSLVRKIGFPGGQAPDGLVRQTQRGATRRRSLLRGLPSVLTHAACGTQSKRCDPQKTKNKPAEPKRSCPRARKVAAFDPSVFSVGLWAFLRPQGQAHIPMRSTSSGYCGFPNLHICGAEVLSASGGVV